MKKVKKVEWDFIEYNHKIHELHYKDCELCKNSEDLSYCICCGEHKHCLDFCYWCGDVVCQKCCPIPLPEHNHTFEAIEDDF